MAAHRAAARYRPYTPTYATTYAQPIPHTTPNANLVARKLVRRPCWLHKCWLLLLFNRMCTELGIKAGGALRKLDVPSFTLCPSYQNGSKVLITGVSALQMF